MPLKAAGFGRRETLSAPIRIGRIEHSTCPRNTAASKRASLFWVGTGTSSRKLQFSFRESPTIRRASVMVRSGSHYGRSRMSRVLVYQANGVQGAATLRRVRQAGFTSRALIRDASRAAALVDLGV